MIQIQANNSNKYLIHVDGIRCISCVNKLEKLAESKKEVTQVKVFFGESLVEVATAANVTSQRIIGFINELGFQAKLLENKQSSFELDKKSNRIFLNQVAVAGFCAGNIMLFSIPIYAGADGYYLIVFSNLSALLFLPILLFSASSLFKNAYSSLKTKTLSIDLPIVIALTSGFLFSTYNLISSNYDHLYYDSTASFIFLILVARYTLHRLQQNYIATYSDLDLGLNQTYKLTSGELVEKESLARNTIFSIQRGQTLVVEAKQQTALAEWNLALLNGESEPKVFLQNMLVPSGAVLISELATMQAETTYQESTIFKLQQKLLDTKNKKVNFVSFMDTFANYFIVSVFSIAALFFAFYARVNTFEAFQRSLALLIVACPCAIALGTPLAYLMGVYKSKKSKILIFNKEIFDQILKVKTVFLDKTGTLTTGKLGLEENIPDAYTNLLLNMSSVSRHPTAFAIRKKYGHLFQPLVGLKVNELIGRGLAANYNGNVYHFIKSTSQDEVMTASTFYENNKPIFQLRFKDQIRLCSLRSIENLQRYFSNTVLLSGDKGAITSSIAESLQIKDFYANLSPEEKAKIVSMHPNSMMIGDGLNDVLALQAADVSIAVQGSVQESANHADAYFLESGIAPVINLLEISRQVRSTIYSNLWISMVYNVSAGSLALLGYINPLMAAILMPLSSGFILLNTYRGLK
jgi:Cu+-exporting ATPase